jgi:hypothetical protein
VAACDTKSRGGAWQCPWNTDGTLLAVADFQGLEYDLWDTKSWTRKRHLSIPLSAAEKQIVRHLAPVGLSFDSHGNVYTALPYTGWDGSVPQLLRAKVWWGGDRAVENSKSIGGCDVSSVDLSVAPMGQETRVAISNENAKCTLEILRIQGPGGKRIVRREYALTAVEAHGLNLARICLTNDGKYLVGHDGFQLCVFELSDTQAKLVYSRPDKIATSMPGVLLHLFDVSLNGHFAAYGADHRIRVIKIPDGQTALEIEQEPDSLALSPDGRLLALISRKRKSILLYHVSQAQK